MLTYVEQQNVLNGVIQVPDIPLSNLMALVAVDFAIEFRETVKQFETVDNTDPQNPIAINTAANQYKNTILGICGQVLNFERNHSGGLLNSFVRVFVGILGRSAFTYAQLEGATQVQWENFVKTGNPGSATGYAGILEIFEHIAGTTIEGKAEYEALI